MALSPFGAIAYVLWHEIPHRMKYVELGEFVVMPNHIHGVLIIGKSNRDNNVFVATLHATSLQKQPSNLKTIPSTMPSTVKNEEMAAISPQTKFNIHDYPIL